MINLQTVETIALNFKRHQPEFSDKAFIAQATSGLEKLELKARTIHITHAMIDFLPKDFKQAAPILLSSLGPELKDELFIDTDAEEGVSGWAMTSLTHYVALRGQEHFELSMELLKEMTKRFTAEFDIRYFITAAPEKTLKVLHRWAKDKNHHVRRLASEGSRPKLPWGMSLPVFIKDPSPLLALLEQLKDDDKEYVRRSVANNLNDIAKNHPDVVAAIAKEWMTDASKERQKLVRHACRTLLKNGHKNTLAVFGYLPPKLKTKTLTVKTPTVNFGGHLEFSLDLSSGSKNDQALMVDYIVHHQKANGTTTPKVFKWRTVTLKAGENQTTSKKHPMKKITTRAYHPGAHALEVMINGVSVGRVDFELAM